jgi:hypothetical protein
MGDKEITMDLKTLGIKAAAFVALAAFSAAPLTANAQNTYKHRQETKNNWRNLAIGSGAVGLLGLLKGDSTLTFLGAAGALYSANRYEQDRKSQSRMSRARYTLFRQGSFTRDGHTYKRRTVYRHGKKYYQFVRVS